MARTAAKPTRRRAKQARAQQTIALVIEAAARILQSEGLFMLLRGVAFDPDESVADGLRRLLRLLVQARPDAPVLYRSLEQVPNALFRRRVAEARGSVIEWVRE